MGKARLARTPSPEEKPPAKSRCTPWLIGIVVLIAAVAHQSGGDVASGASSMARIGSPAPDFTLRLFDGKSITLSSLKGKPVVVNFWHSG